MTEQPVFDFSSEANATRMPAWIRQAFAHENYPLTARSISQHALNTVCVEARCPNRGECWSRGTATFMLLGDTCTRACGFCAVKTGKPDSLDLDEPRRVSEAVAAMGLDYIVLTSVNRDDLADGGAAIFANTIDALRQQNANIQIELLTPDFYRKQQQAIEQIKQSLFDAAGDDQLVWGHNVETVPRLYQSVRKGADYQRSLSLLEKAAQENLETKSALMLGLGETFDEVRQVLIDLNKAGVSRVALGQYLRPTRYHLAVKEYINPERFAEYGTLAREIGFNWVKSGPLVRSSYHAEDNGNGV
jgi:lipoic acid synthetase